jgi:sialate O-acetylesterase
VVSHREKQSEKHAEQVDFNAGISVSCVRPEQLAAKENNMFKGSISSRANTLFLALVGLYGFALRAQADVTLPAILSDHMVLQRDVAATVWGWADPGEDVTITCAGQERTAKADDRGKWTVKLANLKAGGPYTLTVKGKNTLSVKDVLIGEVWLGSGQSNMGMPVNVANDFEKEQKTADLPQVRLFKEASPAAKTPHTIGAGKWVVCTPDTVGTFSATLFFFGREIHKTLHVPVGLINSSVGGTPIEKWISPSAQEQSVELKPFFQVLKNEDAKGATEDAIKKYKLALAKWQEDAKKARAAKEKVPQKPVNPADAPVGRAKAGELFNGKIAPLIPYTIRGALWYQGEANTIPGKAPYYQYQLPLLVNDWRSRWGYDFPFAWVQLPNFDAPERDWPTVREAMLKTLKLPHTGMAITIDVGDAKDIHPKKKQEIGYRLSLWALGTVYGQKVAATSGPLPAGHKINGGEIVLSFQHTNGGLVAKGPDLKGFVIAGADKQWYPGKARIEGDKVIVSSPDVKTPLAVRYAWENNPQCNLFNGAGLPASPFRTDDWP